MAGTPSSIGEHVLKKRFEDGLTRKELAPRLGVDEFAVTNLKLGRSKTVPVKAMPAISVYWGYNLAPRPDTVGGQIRWKLRSLGWTNRDGRTKRTSGESDLSNH